MCKLKAGPESGLRVESLLWSSTPQPWAWIVPRGDVVEIAVSQPDVHILWEHLAREGLGTLWDGERE